MANALPALSSRHSPAMPRIGEPASSKRHLVLGDDLPVNSKNAEAGITHRLLLVKSRPSERKLNTGGPPARCGADPQRIAASSTALPAATRTGAASPTLTSSATGRLAA